MNSLPLKENVIPGYKLPDLLRPRCEKCAYSRNVKDQTVLLFECCRLTSAGFSFYSSLVHPEAVCDKFEGKGV